MNIYISNLSYDVNDSDLRELFEEYGEVSSAKLSWIEKPEDQEVSGFVEMSDDTKDKKLLMN